MSLVKGIDNILNGCMANPPETFGERLRRLRDAKGMSRSELSRATVLVDPDSRGLPEITVKAHENGRRLQPQARTFELLAAALDVLPAEFPEYRLLLARNLLDEQVVGLEAALKRLAAIEDSI